MSVRTPVDALGVAATASIAAGASTASITATVAEDAAACTAAAFALVAADMATNATDAVSSTGDATASDAANASTHEASTAADITAVDTTMAHATVAVATSPAAAAAAAAGDTTNQCMKFHVENNPMSRVSAECAICLDELQGDDKSIIIVTCCKNKFHSACYMNFMDIKQECPLCRAQFVSTTDTVIHAHSMDANERHVFAVCKRTNTIFGIALCVWVLYVTLNWIEP